MDINSFQPTGDESKIEPSTATGIARGPERAFRLDGPGYLGSRPYLEYRAKPARGIGKDGEIVWSDEIEHAFQQALMERDSQQRQQGTKDGPGRNEFIAKHIERLTGKTRTNKQVSSHIRHLDSFLKGDPDWERLVRPGGTADSVFQSNGSPRSTRTMQLTPHQHLETMLHQSAIQVLEAQRGQMQPNQYTPQQFAQMEANANAQQNIQKHQAQQQMGLLEDQQQQSGQSRQMIPQKAKHAYQAQLMRSQYAQMQIVKQRQSAQDQPDEQQVFTAPYQGRVLQMDQNGRFLHPPGNYTDLYHQRLVRMRCEYESHYGAPNQYPPSLAQQYGPGLEKAAKAWTVEVMRRDRGKSQQQQQRNLATQAQNLEQMHSGVDEMPGNHTPSRVPPHHQQSKFVDSGYGSSAPGKSVATNDKDQIRNKPPQLTSGITSWPRQHDMEIVFTADGEAAGEAIESLAQIEEEGSIYSTASSVTGSSKIAYVKSIAKAISERLKINITQDDIQEQVCKAMPALLKDLSLSIGENAESSLDLDLMYFIRKNRKTIAESCQEMLSSEQKSWQNRDKSEAMSLTEKLRRWHANDDLEESKVTKQEGKDLSDAQSEDDILDEELPGLERYEAILNSSPAYGKFFSELNRECATQSTDVDILGSISRGISQMLPISRKVSRKATPQRFHVTFVVEWDPIAFIKEQEYLEGPENALANAIVLTGSTAMAQASTCAGYLRQTWPSSGIQVLQLIQDLVKKYPSSESLSSLPDHTSLSAQLLEEANRSKKYSIQVLVIGISSWVIEVGVILSWMGSALRSSPVEDRPATCRPFLLPQVMDEPKSNLEVKCKINFSAEPIICPPTSNGTCWVDLFRNPVVVEGYPIKRRSILHPGLEMHIGLMAILVGTSHVQPFAGKLFFKGFSTMLMSIKRDTDVMLWHLTSCKDGERVSYNEGIHLSNYTVQPADLEHSRHILGWCSAAICMAGDPHASYQIESSNLPKASKGCLLANASITTSHPIDDREIFAVGKKDSRVRGAGSHYTKNLKWIEQKFFLLWDEEEKRGWLVNGTSTLLHLVLASLERDGGGPFMSTVAFDRNNLKYPRRYQPCSASWTLGDGSNRQAYVYEYNDDQRVRFDEHVTELFEVLEKTIDLQSAALTSCPALGAPRSRLEGWELNNLVSECDPIYAKEAKLDPAGLSWVDLIRSIRAVTLFGSGFGDIIRSSASCTEWSQVPTGKSYLTVCHEDLKRIATNCCGNLNSNPPILTDQIIWHVPDRISARCECTVNDQSSHSDIVQTLLPSKLARRLPPMKKSGKLSGGAFIFGENQSNLWYWPDTGEPLRQPFRPRAPKSDHGSESLSHDSGIGDSLSSSESVSIQSMDRSYDRVPAKRAMLSLRTTQISTHAYTVGIICALPIELKAVRMLFDESHKRQAPPTDPNAYVFGCMSDNFVVATCLPNGEYGIGSATDVASNMKRTFLSLQFCLLVGIGGGAPSATNDIRLGDVVVSKPVGENVGVLQYDMVKTLENGNIQLNGHLQPSPRFLRSVSSLMQSDPSISLSSLEPYLQQISEQDAEFSYPGAANDNLFHPQHPHPTDQPTCDNCDPSKMQDRPKRSTSHPRIHYGLIASGNQVMKSAETRDNIAKKYNVMCFEMEAAGIVNILPSLIIRGICDYSDSHKNKEWQNYAAATAAAFAKHLLSHVVTATEPAYRFYSRASPDRIEASGKHRMREDSYESSDCEMHIAKRRCS